MHELNAAPDCKKASIMYLNGLYSHSDDRFSIIAINLRGFASHFDEFLCLLSEIRLTFSVIIAVETFLNDYHDGLYSIDGYDHVSLNRMGHGGGIRIYFTYFFRFSVFIRIYSFFEFAVCCRGGRLCLLVR